MPGTRHIGGGRTGRTARWLAAAVLAPALAACGGGGGSGSAGGSPAGQGGGGSGGNSSAAGSSSAPQTDDVRTKESDGNGGFSEAGQVSGSATGQPPDAVITLSSTSTKTFTATISDISDCQNHVADLPSGSIVVTVAGGTSEPASVTIPGADPSAPLICFTVTIGYEKKSITTQWSHPSPQSPSGSSGAPSGGGTPSGSAP
ncbi:hypothetical protein ACFQ6N_11600 [Kitasatospora sp. NPDC056446]|uniref:hypothetical protein n=1 Tax=Kitasatospora sp. NPDC056446 TaxID=3345819 RepID=UPI00369390EA